MKDFFPPSKNLKTANYGDYDQQWYAAKNFIDLFDDDIDRITLSQMRNVLGGPLSMRPQWPQGSQRSICYTVTFSSPWMMLRLGWVSIKNKSPHTAVHNALWRSTITSKPRRIPLRLLNSMKRWRQWYWLWCWSWSWYWSWSFKEPQSALSASAVVSHIYGDSEKTTLSGF